MKKFASKFYFVLIFLVMCSFSLFSQGKGSDAPANTTPPSDVNNKKTVINNSNSDKVTSDYYIGSSVVFCEGVNETTGEAKTPASVFTISSAGGFVYVLIKHSKPFKTTEMIVDIWKGNDYADFVDTKYITIEDNWQFTYFKYTFKDAGKYKFSVFNKDQTFIEAGYVTVEVE
ncbi:MAG: hypothetical protein HXX09_04255 [Bacteroidetes bacterium]|nr:hypothetical protein [Bacteroidota bacterium]